MSIKGRERVEPLYKNLGESVEKSWEREDNILGMFYKIVVKYQEVVDTVLRKYWESCEKVLGENCKLIFSKNVNHWMSDSWMALFTVYYEEISHVDYFVSHTVFIHLSWLLFIQSDIDKELSKY